MYSQQLSVIASLTCWERQPLKMEFNSNRSNHFSLKSGLLFGLLFFLFPSAFTWAQPNITKMEYFIDADPGRGLGVDIPLVATPNLDIGIKVPTGTLSFGFHLLTIRVQDQNGAWSLFENKGFFVAKSATTSQNDITKIEYFIDADPGRGAGVDVPVTAAASFDFLENIPTATLTEGFHLLSIRAQDENGVWSLSESKVFFVSQSSTLNPNNITKLEYFIDTDPGQGGGIDIPITSGVNLNILERISTASMSEGFHLLTVRTQDENGNWSLTENKSFFVDKGRQIIAYEYALDTDPGIGLAINQPIVPPQDSINLTLLVDTNPLALGAHNLVLRVQDSNLFWSKTQIVPFAICDGANAAFITTNTVCQGSISTFTDNSLNVLAGDIYSWDFDGDGFEDSNSSGNQSFTYGAPGTYLAKLTIDRLGCLGKDSVLVIIEPLTVASAGLDQAICTTNTILSANPLGTNETGNWVILSGGATISNPLDPLSTLTGITSNDVQLIWSINNAVGGCSDQDTVRITTANLPISAAAITDNVDIGQIINFDVQSLATINPGDVLTTSIQTIPIYGVANLLADGTIDYIPDPDANSNDSFIYRLTNGCNNFAENSVTLTVNNAPPAIDTAAVTTQVNPTEIIIDLAALLSDLNNNIDLSTLTIITQPLSGASASIDINGVLTIDYTGVTYSGFDVIIIQVCDLAGLCATATIGLGEIDKVNGLDVTVLGSNPPITVFNGVSPDGDGFNDFLEIENIEAYPDNTVIILNRWGAQIAKYQGYNNQDIVFNNATLPSGTYYYHILPGVKDIQEVTGHFVLKID
jgi:gliding motility-associated-like protein